MFSCQDLIHQSDIKNKKLVQLGSFLASLPLISDLDPQTKILTYSMRARQV